MAELRSESVRASGFPVRVDRGSYAVQHRATEVCELMMRFMLFIIIKEIAMGVSDPKEENEEEEVSSALSHSSPVSTARPSRSWRSSRSATAARQRDTENSRASRSKTGSLQLVCKSEPNTDQLEYGTWEALA